MEYYGVYMELIYLHCEGQILFKMDEIFKMNANKFLFISEYLLRKRKINADEQNRILKQNK